MAVSFRTAAFTMVAGVLAGLLADPMSAQLGQSTGGIHGKVVDEQGGVLPNVSVIVQGPGAARTLVTDARGEFHLVNLSPGGYSILLAREGFATLDRSNVTVALGKDTELTFAMSLSAVMATVTVSDEVPLIDTRRVGTGAAVSQQELRDIPTARDPWVILQTVPGIQVDRVNVAGSESGAQSAFSSKGTFGSSYQLDGVNMGEGGSTAYYDFDSFQEMQVITGGSDPSIRGSSAHVNMITKRGTNEVHGSARVFAVDDHFESDNLPQEASDQPFPLSEGNRIQSIQDYGVEIGGPVWKEHVWLWGAYSRNQIDLVAAGGVPNKTTLEDFNAKLNWQVVRSNSAEVWYFRSDKLLFGRLAGPTHPVETTWDQITPQNTWKVQDSQVLSSSFFASAMYASQNGNFELRPEGGLAPQMFLDEQGVWHNTYAFFRSPISVRQVRADTSYFFSTGSLGHELKLGFSYFRFTSSSTTVWPGDGSNGLAEKTWGDLYDCTVPCAVITRDSHSGLETRSWGAFLGDTITFDRLTVNLGLRWDEQYGTNSPSAVPANPTFPTILPAFYYPGRGRDFTWKDWQPRFGVTYALGASRSTVLRASYAQYAEALPAFLVAIPNNSFFSPYAYYAWNDVNENDLVEPDEVDTSEAGFQFSRNYNPAAPSDVALPTNLVSPGLQAPSTTEIVGGVEHELAPGFAVGVNYTFRKFQHQVFGPPSTYDPNTGYRLSYQDYEQYATLTGTTPDGVVYSQPVYRIKESVLDSLGLCTPNAEGGLDCSNPAGAYYVNRPEFNQTYSGVELVLTKRLTNRWMARGSFVYNNNVQHLTGPGACIDPTNLLTFFDTTSAQSCRNDDLVAVQSYKGSVYLNSKWQFSFVGLYQLPMGFAVAASLYGRQGYPIMWYEQAPASETDGLTRNVAVLPANASRYENVYEFDFRFEKVINIAPTATVTLSADLFNATNQNTVLQRQNRLGIESTNSIREIQSPRIWRFGARVSF